MRKFLIKTPGRTGSHIITDFLSYNNKNFIKHEQLYKVPPNPEEWIFVFSKRRNWFDMACSRVITSHTKQYGPYNLKENLQVKTDIESLIDSAGYAKNWYNTFKVQSQTYNWQDVYIIYYEDIKENKEKLKILDSSIANYNFKKTMISPYEFKDVIVDYNTLKLQFIQWQHDVGLLDE
jgi:hypothetical protein